MIHKCPIMVYNSKKVMNFNFEKAQKITSNKNFNVFIFITLQYIYKF